jgi:hypothetical protein
LRKFDAGTSRLREADGDGLFRGSRPMLALADVMHFFADERPCLRGRRASGLLGLSRTFNRCLFWHRNPPIAVREATKVPSSRRLRSDQLRVQTIAAEKSGPSRAPCESADIFRCVRRDSALVFLMLGYTLGRQIDELRTESSGVALTVRRGST